MGVTSRWINPNAVPLTQDRFSDNGTFSAAKEGKYGYDKVSVGVSEDRVIGKDPDTDEDVEVREEPEPKDPYRPDEGGEGGEGGEKPPHLVETVLPSQIAVVKPPDKTSYLLWDTIDYTGIQVQARLKSGQPWDGFPNGMIPYEELVFPVKALDGTSSLAGEVSQVEVRHVGDIGETLKYLSERAGVSTITKIKFETREDEARYNACNGRNVASIVIGTIKTAIPRYNFIHIHIFSVYTGGMVEPGRLYHYNGTFSPGTSDVTDEIVLHYTPAFWDEYDYIETEYREVIPSSSSPDYIDYRIGTANFYSDSPKDIPIYTATSDLDCGIAQPIRFSTRGVAVCAPETEGGRRHRETHFSGGCIALAPRGNAICYITASAGGGSMDIVDKWIDGDAGSESEESETVSTGSSFTYDGQTVHYASGSVAMDGAIASYLPDTSGDGAALIQHAGEIAWTMVYGNVSGTDKALPVQWARPGDGQVLETEFNISVAVPVE